jgi:hypothetical protein
VAADAASSEPGRLLSEAVAGGLLITEGVVGCSLTEIDAGRFRTPVYAGEAAIVLDLVQYAAGRGPCLTAIRHGQLGHPGNLGGSDSWEDAGPWRHRRSTRMNCANAR